MEFNTRNNLTTPGHRV